MKAVQTNLQDFINESKFFRIPDFQRPYAWKNTQGHAFWESFSDSVSSSKRHYFGSIVFFEDGDNRVIIDGQQRLTTTLLFITACYHALIDDSRKSWKYTAESIGRDFLYNEESGELRVILRGATSDRHTFDRILRRKTLPIDEQSKLYEMYMYFVECVNSLEKIDPYLDVLQRFDVISISLQPEDDNPQVIFENINATGEPLTDGDKIRNFALMLNTEEARDIVYKEYWLKLESTLTRRGDFSGVGDQLITHFFRTFLTIKYNDKVINEKNTYEMFKEYYHTATPEQSVDQLRSVWGDITSILENYTYIFYDEDITDSKIFGVFDEDIKDKNEDYTKRCLLTYMSFFIQLLEYYKKGEITRNDFRNVLSVVRKQRIRDDIGRAGSLKLINSTANAAYKYFQEYEMRSYFDAYLWYMEGAGDASKSRNATDEEMEFSIVNKDIDDKQAKFLLREIDITYDENISHSLNGRLDRIMPKAIYGTRLDDRWKIELGEDWEIINQRFYGKLANTALVGYAPTTNKNLTYEQKLNKFDGIRNASNHTTKWIADNCEEWNLETIKKRTYWLRDELIELYKIPKAITNDRIKEKFGHD